MTFDRNLPWSDLPAGAFYGRGKPCAVHGGVIDDGPLALASRAVIVVGALSGARGRLLRTEARGRCLVALSDLGPGVLVSVPVKTLASRHC